MSHLIGEMITPSNSKNKTNKFDTLDIEGLSLSPNKFPTLE